MCVKADLTVVWNDWPAPGDWWLYSSAAGLRTVSDDAVTMTTVVRSNNTHFHCSFSSTGRNVEP